MIWSWFVVALFDELDVFFLWKTCKRWLVCHSIICHITICHSFDKLYTGLFTFYYYHIRIKPHAASLLHALKCTQNRQLRIGYGSVLEVYHYSRFSHCGHLAITDTPPLRTEANPSTKCIKKWLKQTHEITNYYELSLLCPPRRDNSLVFSLAIANT